MNNIDSVYFSYDGIRSDEMGILLVKTDSGMIGEPYIAEKEIISEQIFGRDIPYIYGFQNKPFQIKITLTLSDGGLWTTDKRREVARWLDTNRFSEFYSTDDVDKIYYLCLEGSSELYTNGLQQGYIELTFRSLSPYTYTQIRQKNLDFSTITTPASFELINSGDNELHPEMWMYKVGAGDVSIVNLSDNGREFKLTGLAADETVYIRNEDRYIETDLFNMHRYDSFNGNYLRLLRGNNYLKITGTCEIKLKYRFAIRG